MRKDEYTDATIAKQLRHLNSRDMKHKKLDLKAAKVEKQEFKSPEDIEFLNRRAQSLSDRTRF